MKALRVLRNLPFFSLQTHKTQFNPSSLCHFFSAETQPDHPTTSTPSSSSFENETEIESSDFDSAQFTLPPQNPLKPTQNGGPTWDDRYRERTKRIVFGEQLKKKKIMNVVEEEEERGEEERKRALARALLQAALDGPDEEEEEEEEGLVGVEDQKSLSVGIIGAPNAGKSALTNYMTVVQLGSRVYRKQPLCDLITWVRLHTSDPLTPRCREPPKLLFGGIGVGTKVAAVSRKTNTTTHEVLGVMTKGDTQVCFFDTPGLMLKKSGFPSRDIKARIESAWSSVNLYDVLIVIFDVHRHLTRPDSRVVRLIQRMGSEPNLKQKRILCMNKIDLVARKKDLLKVSEDFKDLQGYERVFMISGLKGSGMKDLTAYLMEQAVKRPWDEDPFTMSEEVMKNISLEVVRERLLDHVHQEIPYEIDHRLMDWKELRDGSLRIEQHFTTHKQSQRRILVGKNGSKIGRIGMEANEELRSIFKRHVHLILQVKLK